MNVELNNVVRDENYLPNGISVYDDLSSMYKSDLNFTGEMGDFNFKNASSIQILLSIIDTFFAVLLYKEQKYNLFFVDTDHVAEFSYSNEKCSSVNMEINDITFYIDLENIREIYSILLPYLEDYASYISTPSESLFSCIWIRFLYDEGRGGHRIPFSE